MELLLILGGISAGVGSYALVRSSSVKKKQKIAQKKLPSDRLLIWAPPTHEHKKLNNHIRSSVNKHLMSNKEAVISGGLGAIPSFYYLTQIDENVLEAIDFAFAEDLSNFQDLHNYISDKYTDAIQADSAEGWMTRLEGYVNEQYAADILEKMGFEVEFPKDPNQAGYDLLVDGEPWQVKGGESPSVITNHFENNPDIPVVTSDTLASEFQNDVQIQGFSELDPAFIEQTTSDSLHAIDNLGDHMGAGIPIATAVLSGFREFGLLSSGKTDLEHSIFNAGLDIAGTGGGGFAGAKIGALLGSAGGPAGAAIGGAIGGILGAISGRAVTQSIKEKPYQEALRKYKNQYYSSKYQLDYIQKEERSSLEKTIQEMNDHLNRLKDAHLHEYKQSMYEHREDIFRLQKTLVEETPRILLEVKHELRETEEKLLHEIRRSHPILRLLMPTQDDIYYREIRKWFQNRYRILDEAMNRFSEVPARDEDIISYYQEIMSFFRNHITNHDILTKTLKDIYEETQQTEHMRKSTKKRIFEDILSTENQIRQAANKSFSRILTFLNDQKSILKKLEKKVKIERDRLGY